MLKIEEAKPQRWEVPISRNQQPVLTHESEDLKSMSATTPHPPPPGVVIKDFTSLPPKERQVVADKVAKLERKVFPSGEGFDYDVELKKKNIGLVLAFNECDQDSIVAYLVYQRMKRVIWLHKLCVVEHERQKGIGRCLIHVLRHQMEKRGGESIRLWVDEHREPARALYDSCGFQQVEVRSDYYAPGRAGLKMELLVER